jgi:hypothetical protein
MGTPYVPLDSWIYPAFDRLIALGYVRSAIVAQRPRTRLECLRLLHEANELVESESLGNAALWYAAANLAHGLGGGAQLLFQLHRTRLTGLTELTSAKRL